VTSLVLSRTTTWMLALWSGYIATWAVASGSGPASVAAWWLAGVGVMQTTASRATRPEALEREPAESADDTPDSRGARSGTAVQEWEAEGGAIA
jgi:hypothetical protein